MLVFGGVGGFNDFLIFTPFFGGGRNDPIRYQLISYDEIMDLLLNISWYISKLSSNIPCTALAKSVGGHFLQPKTSLQTLWTHFCWWFFSPPKRVDFFCLRVGKIRVEGIPSPRSMWPISRVAQLRISGMVHSTNFFVWCIWEMLVFSPRKNRFHWSLRGKPTLLCSKLGRKII